MTDWSGHVPAVCTASLNTPIPVAAHVTASDMTEDMLLAAIIDYCGWLHLQWFHDYDPKRNPPGFPDLFIAGPGGHLIAELKTSHGQLKPDQVKWKYTLQSSGAPWRLWRPGDWISGKIGAELRFISQGRELS